MGDMYSGWCIHGRKQRMGRVGQVRLFHARAHTHTHMQAKKKGSDGELIATSLRNSIGK